MKKRKNNRYLLIAVAVCVLAAGVGTFTALRELPETVNSSSAKENAGEAFTLIKPEPSEAVAANDKVSGVPDLRPHEAYSAAAEPESESTAGSGTVLPLGTRITKDFSAGELVYSETMKDWRTHNGIDFGGESGDTVFSACRGEVDDVYTDDFWGTVIEIRISDSVTARYCGVEPGVPVAKGDMVSPGDAIAVLGEIPVECADGSHLHFEIIVNGEPADPLAFLKLDKGAE